MKRVPRRARFSKRSWSKPVDGGYSLSFRLQHRPHSGAALRMEDIINPANIKSRRNNRLRSASPPGGGGGNGLQSQHNPQSQPTTPAKPPHHPRCPWPHAFPQLYRQLKPGGPKEALKARWPSGRKAPRAATAPPPARGAPAPPAGLRAAVDSRTHAQHKQWSNRLAHTRQPRNSHHRQAACVMPGGSQLLESHAGEPSHTVVFVGYRPQGHAGRAFSYTGRRAVYVELEVNAYSDQKPECIRLGGYVRPCGIKKG